MKKKQLEQQEQESLDSIIYATKQMLQEQYHRTYHPWNWKHPYAFHSSKWLDITVTPRLEHRAIQVFIKIWNHVEKHGYRFIMKAKSRYGESNYVNCLNFIVVRNHEIRVELKEINERIQDPESTYQRTILHGTGKLKFVCHERDDWYPSLYQYTAAQDTPRTRIEDKFDNIIHVLEKIADKRDDENRRQKEAEEQRKQKEEQERIEQERLRIKAEKQARRQARKDKEEQKLKELLIESLRVRLAEIIRDYTSDFESNMTGKMDEKKLNKRLQWMRNKADFIDPFINRKDKWLTKDDINQLFINEIDTASISVHPTPQSRSEPDDPYTFWQIRNKFQR